MDSSNDGRRPIGLPLRLIRSIPETPASVVMIFLPPVADQQGISESMRTWDSNVVVGKIQICNEPVVFDKICYSIRRIAAEVVVTEIQFCTNRIV